MFGGLGGLFQSAPASAQSSMPVIPQQPQPAIAASVPAIPAAAAAQGGPMNPWTHDVKYAMDNLRSGIPGIERELHDTMWNIEHIGTHGAAETLLRGIIMIGIVYLGAGCFYKYQSMGATGMDMIPHLGFWREYPSLVVDGVKYAIVLVSAYIPGSDGGRYSSGSGFGGGNRGGFMPVGGAGDKDTFASFEPSKC